MPEPRKPVRIVTGICAAVRGRCCLPGLAQGSVACRAIEAVNAGAAVATHACARVGGVDAAAVYFALHVCADGDADDGDVYSRGTLDRYRL